MDEARSADIRLRLLKEAEGSPRAALYKAALRAYEALKARQATEPPPASQGAGSEAPEPGPKPGPKEEAGAPAGAPGVDEKEEGEALPSAKALERAEALLRRAGDWEALGPLRGLVRLLVALALEGGARKNPHREGVFFLAQWEVATSLGVQTRTLERWLNDLRYEQYRRTARRWIAWRVWMTGGEAVGLPHPVKGGTVWRVAAHRPWKRGRQVLAPHLRVRWRDLAEDIRQGRTARTRSGGGRRRGWATLRMAIPSIPSTSGPGWAAALRGLLLGNLPSSRPGRHAWAKDVARAVARALGDQKSELFWLRAAWAALRSAVYGERGPMAALFRAVMVAREATLDGFARSGGAYAHFLLKKWGFFDTVAMFDGHRVG